MNIKRFYLTVGAFLLLLVIFYLLGKGSHPSVDKVAKRPLKQNIHKLDLKVIRPLPRRADSRARAISKGENKVAIRIFVDYSVRLHQAVGSTGGAFFIYDLKDRKVVGKLTPEFKLVRLGASTGYISGFRVRKNLERAVLEKLGLNTDRYRLYLYIPRTITDHLRKSVAERFGNADYMVASITLKFRRGRLVFELNKVTVNGRTVSAEGILWSN